MLSPKSILYLGAVYSTHDVGPGAAQVRHLEVGEVAEGGGPGSVEAARLPPAPRTEHLQQEESINKQPFYC